MLSNIPGNKEYVDYFFKNHKLFFCDNLPWQFYNLENSKRFNSTNLEVRLDYLFSKQGFFNRMDIENNFPEHFDEYADYSYNFKNKRYISQELISNGFNNPTHTSFKNNSNDIVIDFDNPTSVYKKTSIVTHPGNTRFYSSTFLQKNLNKCFIYVNKKYYYDGMFKTQLKEIKTIEEAFSYWKPVENVKPENRRYDFVHIKVLESDNEDTFMGSKRHLITDCSILKLWKLLDNSKVNDITIRGVNYLDTLQYMSRVNESGKELANIIFEKNLTIYTNSNKDLKKYFLNVRNGLIKSAKNFLLNYKKLNKDFVFDKVDKFDFDVVVVDKKPNNISELNGNKGFAIWIDKDMVEKTNREIFEFLCFTRRDVKLAETKDGKISVVNCRDINSNIKWVIHEEFLKCGVNTDEK